MAGGGRCGAAGGDFGVRRIGITDADFVVINRNHLAILHVGICPDGKRRPLFLVRHIYGGIIDDQFPVFPKLEKRLLGIIPTKSGVNDIVVPMARHYRIRIFDAMPIVALAFIDP